AQGKTEGASASTSSVSAEEQWAIDAGLYEDMSSDELYKKALAEEGGKVVVYSISSRMAKVKTAFEADYPGMTLEAYDISSNDMATKLKTEYGAGIRTVDVVHSKEQNGEYIVEFFDKGILHNYQPASIFGNVNKEYLSPLTPLYFESDWWFYNTNVYKENPITNWWDVTKPEWKGKFILQNPIGTVSYMSLFTQMVANADQMAAAYKECFGTDIVLDKDEPTAAHAWMKRVLANDPVIMDSNNEVIKAVGEGTTSQLIGYAPSSKYRERADKGWNIASDPVAMKPMSGAGFMNFVAVVNEAPHPYGAMLLIRYLLGGEDGNGKGIQPFNTIGGWVVRPETVPAEGNIALDAMPMWNLDFNYIYENIQDVQDYWYQHR
ncbi:MAG: extracellular solute-binding protein, partial [Sphaerochaetaceae bacterium]|nr:extracellular solute-binding protein [Sphaerochaetaceae bacterium]